MAEANDADHHPSLPRRGKVQSVREQWSVHEDGALAYQIQNDEITQHYGLNRFHRRTVREDIPVAKVVQTEEEIRQQEERLRELEALKAQAEEDELVARRVYEQQRQETQSIETVQALDDEEIARQLQEKEKKKYERHLEKKREKKLKQERLRLEAELARDIEEAGMAVKEGSGSDNAADRAEALGAQGVNITRITPAGHIEDGGDFSDFYNLPNEMDEFTRLEIQASQDEELARLLQEQEHKRTKAEVDKDKMKRIEQQDQELARVMQEQEKMRLRKAKMKHQQKKDAQRQKAVDSLPLGASANTMNQDVPASSISGAMAGAAVALPPSTGHQQHSHRSNSPAIPTSEGSSGGGGGGGSQQHRYRRNSYTQAFDSPPSPPRSQPPPRPAPNKSRLEQKEHPSTHYPVAANSSLASSQFPTTSSHAPHHNALSSSSSSAIAVQKGLSHRPPMPLPSNNASGMSTLESARRIAAGDHEGIFAAQHVSSSPHLSGVLSSTPRDISNADVVRSSSHTKIPSSRSIGGSGTPVDPPTSSRHMLMGDSRPGQPYYQSSEMPLDVGRRAGRYDGSSGRVGGASAPSNKWLKSSMDYSDEEEDELSHPHGSPYLNGSSGFNIAAAIDPTYQRRHPEASRYPPDETQVKTMIPFTRSLPQADGDLEWDPGLRGSLRKTKAPTYGYSDMTASSTMSGGDPGWQPIQGQRRTDTKSKKSSKKPNPSVATEGKKDKNSNCKQQ